MASLEVIVEADVKKAAKELGFIKEKLADISAEERKLAVERVKQIKIAEEYVAALKEEKRAADEAAQAKKDNFKNTAVALNAVLDIAKKAVDALKEIYATAREGAELQFLESRFENLAVSIGTTADVLLDDLKEATRGTLSDMEAMALATDLVGLGLANDAKEAVRMAKVVAGLGADMNQLTLTLTNMTTMRFDAIGVRVDGFKERLAGLEEQGLDTSDAFTEAFLQQAEEQLELVGNAADSSLGTFQKLEARLGNTGNAFKELASDAVEPSIKNFIEYAEAIDEGREAHERMTGEIITGRAYQQNRDEIDETIAANKLWTESIDNVTMSFDASLMNYQNAAGGFIEENEKIVRSVKEISKEYTDYISLTTKLANETEKFNDKQDDNIAKQEETKTKIEEATIKYGAWSDQVKDLEGDLVDLGFQHEENARKHKEATDQILFDLLMQKLSVDGLTDAEFEAAIAAGKMLGVFDEESAKAAADMNAVTSAVADGRLAVEDMGRAIRLLPTLTDIDIILNVIDGLREGGGARGGRGGGGGKGKGGKHGGRNAATGMRDFIVPSGFQNDSFNLGVSSGERVNVETRGQQMSGGGVVVNLTYAPFVSLGSEDEAQSKLTPFIIEGIREAQQSGVLE